jgi:hypothetical protein
MINFVACIATATQRMQQLGKHVPAATNTHAIEQVFCMWSVPKSYNQDSWSNESVKFCKLGWEEMEL